ncbi:MAG TPA: hypothetical protein VI451_22195 [Anaerolineales bacterium]|nr:hypothetical protein [Anaerolineales bacterium]
MSSSRRAKIASARPATAAGASPFRGTHFWNRPLRSRSAATTNRTRPPNQTKQTINDYFLIISAVFCSPNTRIGEVISDFFRIISTLD